MMATVVPGLILGHEVDVINQVMFFQKEGKKGGLLVVIPRFKGNVLFCMFVASSC